MVEKQVTHYKRRIAKIFESKKQRNLRGLRGFFSCKNLVFRVCNPFCNPFAKWTNLDLKIFFLHKREGLDLPDRDRKKKAGKYHLKL